MRRKLAKIFFYYLVTLGVGSIFFLMFARERRLQEERSDEDMTVIDAIYFASVVATSVGYGHRIVPQTETAKGFLVFYFFSTVVVGAIVGNLVNITFEHNQKIVEDEIVRETTWVHRTALLTDKADEVTEADYLIFKLMQLQRVDEDVLHRLQSKFDELDNDLVGCLEVGEEIPSAAEVVAMHETAEAAGVPASEEWLHNEWYKKRKDAIDSRNAAKEAEVRSRRRQSAKSEASTAHLLFPDTLSTVMLVSVSPECCHHTKPGHFDFVVSHPGFKPIKPALDAYFKAHRTRSPVLSPLATITLDEATRKVSNIPPEAVTFGFSYPMSLDRSLLPASSTDLAKLSGPCLLPLNGAFVYFDKHNKLCAVNCFAVAPPEEERSNFTAFLHFEDPHPLPEETLQALSTRLCPVILDALSNRGAKMFAWIDNGECLPGIPPPPDGAFAYVLKGGKGIYFPVLHVDTGVRLKVSEIHDFSFSRGLWFTVCKQTLKKGAAILALYILVGFYAICKVQGWDGPTSWYFLAITFTTVGYGDFAPTFQSTRAIAIALLPLGLIVVGFVISASQAYALSKPPRKTEEDPIQAVLKVLDPKKKQKALEKLLYEDAALFDIDDDGRITRDEVIQMAPVLSITKEQADALFTKLDMKNRGYLEPKTDYGGFFSTISGRIVLLCFQVYWPVLIAAAFFKIPAVSEALFKRSQADGSLTWIDSLYFATVTVTTVGFGDITPQTSGGRIFCAVYIIVNCVWVGWVLQQFISLYVNDYIGEEIVGKIIDSTTYVHKCDIFGNKKVSMPEYLLFKLQELQMVDRKIVDILSARFDELDRDNILRLRVGYDVPSAEQVAELTDEVGWWSPTNRNIMDAWEVMQEKIFTDIERKQKWAELKKEWAEEEAAELAAAAAAAAAEAGAPPYSERPALGSPPPPPPPPPTGLSPAPRGSTRSFDSSRSSTPRKPSEDSSSGRTSSAAPSTTSSGTASSSTAPKALRGAQREEEKRKKEVSPGQKPRQRTTKQGSEIRAGLV